LQNDGVLARFKQGWEGVLADCGAEYVNPIAIRRLTLGAGTAEMDFVLAELARILREWEELKARGDDAGDGSDEYWRMATAAGLFFESMGGSGARFLADRLRDQDALHRVEAASALAGVSHYLAAGELERLIAEETNPEVLEALRAPQPRRPSLWERLRGRS
jgi:hypothetical protein